MSFFFVVLNSSTSVSQAKFISSERNCESSELQKHVEEYAKIILKIFVSNTSQNFMFLNNNIYHAGH